MRLVFLLVGCTTPGGGRDTADSAAESVDTADSGDTADSDTDRGDSADTAPPVDADGDGYSPDDGDCDDTRANVHPGAPDACDGIDQDCDGEAVPDHSCSEPWDPTTNYAWSVDWTDVNASLGADLGDVNGDGRTDLVLGSQYFEYAPETGWPAAYTAADAPWITTGSVRAAWSFPIRDSTGDGIGDVWVYSDYSDYGFVGGVYLMPGRAEGFGDAGLPVWQAADGYWVDGDGVHMAEAAGTGDLTGDGLADVQVVTEDSSGKILLSYVAGGAALAGAQTLGGLPQMFLDETSTSAWAFVTGDLDGDGLDDVEIDYLDAVGRPASFLSGADWSEGGHAGSLVSFVYNGAGPGTGTLYPSLWMQERPGDINGDGLPDTMLAGTDAGGVLCVHLLSGGIPSGDAADWTFAKVCVANAIDWTDDVDDDGVPDVQSSVGVLPSSQLRAGGTFAIEDLTVFKPWSFDYLLTGVTDLDGDGRPDWILNDQHYEDGLGRLLIVPGFDIPWDDPEKW